MTRNPIMVMEALIVGLFICEIHLAVRSRLQQSLVSELVYRAVFLSLRLGIERSLAMGRIAARMVARPWRLHTKILARHPSLLPPNIPLEIQKLQLQPPPPTTTRDCSESLANCCKRTG